MGDASLRADRERLCAAPIEPPLGEEELAFAPIEAFESRIDAFLVGVGLHPLGALAAARWHEIDREHARRVLLHVLSRDLAYGVPRRAPVAARELVAALLSRWLEPARFVVGGDLHEHLDVDGETPGTFSYGSGTALAGIATFEVDLIAIATTEIAAVVVTDED